MSTARKRLNQAIENARQPLGQVRQTALPEPQPELRAQLEFNAQPATLPQELPQTSTQTAQKPELRLIAGTKNKRFSVLMPALCVVSVTAFVAAQMLFTNLTSEGAYELYNLRRQQRDTLRVERVLSQNTMSLTSPQNLADNAKSLGMVQNISPAYLRLSDGAILGTIADGTARPVANLVPNATLQELPVINEAGAQNTREIVSQTGASAAPVIEPVAWEGNLPAPQTH